MILRKIILSLLFVCIAAVGYSQPEKAKTRIVDGKEYYVHKVKRGNTVYGLHRMYDVPVNEILAANPGAADGLDVGEEILIPKATGEALSTDAPEEGEIDTSKYHIHITQQGETLYSIARQYGIKGKDLVRINGDKPLSIGDKVLIPRDAFDPGDISDEVEPVVKDPVNELAQPGDSIILHTVAGGETLYALSRKYKTTQDKIVKANNGLEGGLIVGQEIRIPIPKRSKPAVTDTSEHTIGTIVHQPIATKDVYNVGVFLPFKLDKNDAAMLKCPPTGECKPYIPTLRAVEFYHGVEMAVDSMEKAGLSVNLRVYDTKADTATMKKLLAKQEVKQLDMIFGPLMGMNQKLMAQFSLQNQIQFVSPVSSSNKLLFKNPYATRTVASVPTQVKALAQYVADSFATENIVVFDDATAKDQQYFVKVFRREFAARMMKRDSNYDDTLTVIRKSRGLKSLYSHLNREGLNVLVVPSRNLGYVSSFLTDLNKVLNDHGMRRVSFVVVGLEEWMNFEQVDYEYLNRFNVHIPSSTYLSFGNPDMKDFIKRFRMKHGNDPGEYTYMGFDVMMHHLGGLLHYGSGFASRLNYVQLKHLHTRFNYQPVGEGSGYENQSVYILAYDNYKLIRKR